MNELTALLINVTGIQGYIFSSNKLKENIGASYIIEELVYKETMKEVLETCFETNFLFDWQNQSSDTVLAGDLQCEVGYIGGGNALLFFKDEVNADLFTRAFTLKMLECFPGLRTVFGKEAKYNPETTNFKSLMESLQTSINASKSNYFRETLPFKPGIAKDCSFSGDGLEVFEGMKEEDFKSGKSYAKYTGFEKMSGSSSVFLSQENSEKFMFPSEFDLVSNQGGEDDSEGAYIAVVHVDGNGIGKAFMATTKLSESRKLSKDLSDLATQSMKALIELIIEKEKDLTPKGKGFRTGEEKRILPIRPIITGGDDITFVADGRIGIYLAEQMIRIFEDTAKKLNRDFKASAGIAIVKKKYPFYRAYTLSEELIKQAKDKTKEQSESSNLKGQNYISFLIAEGGVTGTLNDVIKNQYQHNGKSLFGGPYAIGSEFEQLKAGIKHFQEKDSNGKSKWPRNKIMELRSLLVSGTSETEFFKKQMEIREMKLPNGKSDFWNSESTDLLDMINLLEFYPNTLI
jgi:hypothetical protein